MAKSMNMTENTKVELKENYRVVYERKEVLGGLIKWWVRISSEMQGKSLMIDTTEEYDNIIVNGKKII